MHWEHIIKRKRGKRKREPYNPFTGEGDKGLNIEDRMKAREEKVKEREAKVAESFKKVPRARVAIRLGGGSKRSSDSINRNMAQSQNKEVGEGTNLNPSSRCAKCGIKLANSQRTKTLNNASNLTYCNACARNIEGKPVSSLRTNAKGDVIPADDPQKRTPIRRRKFK